MRGVPYDTFAKYVAALEEDGVLVRRHLFGYKKTFRGILLDKNLGHKTKSGAIYVKSVLDGREYCLANGKFKRHLISSGIDEWHYLKKCGVSLPIGYALSFKCDGKKVRNIILARKNGDALFFMYRSIVTSVSSDYRKLMLLYGLSNVEAKRTALENHTERSKGYTGERNNSYGKRGLNANCFRPFLGTTDPKEQYSRLLRERNKVLILRWASDNNIDETSFERIRFLYYSGIFRRIHRTMGEKYKDKFNLDSVDQGIYLYNKEKSLRCYDPKNFLEFNSHLVNLYGNEEDKLNLSLFLKGGEYDKIMSLALPLKNFYQYGKRFRYRSAKHGLFLLKSKLEKGFVRLVDKLDIAVSIKYENVRLPYFDGFKNRTYWIDFEIFLADGRRVLVEVKPYHLCIIPEGEILAKKVAAEKYAARQCNCKYIFATEKDLKYDLVRKKLQSA
jgi:hypothetical protein